MTQESPFLLVKRLEADMFRRLSYVDSGDLSPTEHQLVAAFRNGLVDARLDIQDYELAETREDQLRSGAEAKERLSTAQAFIAEDALGIFGAADVAQFSAKVAQIVDRLQ